MPSKPPVEVTYDLGERIATVSGHCTEKYARKLLQDKLKAETPYAGGWTLWLTNRATMDMEHYKKTGEVRYHKQEDYVFEITNVFATFGWYI